MPEVAPVVDRQRRWARLGPVLALLVVALVVGSVMHGELELLTPRELAAVVAGSPEVTPSQAIAVTARAPRALMAALVGAALGMAGTLLQALVRNPLASPGFVGVSAGAVAATVAFTAFGPALPVGAIAVVLPAVAMAGGFVAATVVYLSTRQLGRLESTRLLLVGVVTGGVLSSGTTISLLFLGEQAESLLGWLTGSLALTTWEDLSLVATALLPGLVLAVLAVPRANLLQLGDDVAVGLGQRRELDRLVVLAAAVALTGAAVCVVGAVGFVGLVGPHIARRVAGNDLRRLMPAAALGGAGMVLVADLISRNLDARALVRPLGATASSGSLPVGVYLTLFGVPFLVSLLRRRAS